jgi:hypothetical protein
MLNCGFVTVDCDGGTFSGCQAACCPYGCKFGYVHGVGWVHGESGPLVERGAMVSERDGVIGPGLIGAMSRDDSVDARHRGRRFEAHLERAEQRIKMIKIMTHRGVCHWQKQTFVYQTCNTIGRERTL